MKMTIGISVWIKIILTSIGLLSSTISKADDFWENEINCIKINTDMLVIDLTTDLMTCYIVGEGMEHCKEHIQIMKDNVLGSDNAKLINFGESGIQYGVPENRAIATFHCYKDPRDKTKGFFYTPQVFILQTIHAYDNFLPQE